MKKSSIDTSQQLVNDNSDYAQMVLDKALHDFQINRILKGIDLSLKNRNKDEFLRLTEELKIIRKQSFIQ
jgi:uncharacterized protein YpiB (UPF0302 family)